MTDEVELISADAAAAMLAAGRAVALVGADSMANPDLLSGAGLRQVGLLVAASGPGPDSAVVHGIPAVALDDLISRHRSRKPVVTRMVETRMPTRHGCFRIVGYRDASTDTEHVAVVFGDPAGTAVIARIHQECLLGDCFGALSCDCGASLDVALAVVEAAGRGVVVYVRGNLGCAASGDAHSADTSRRIGAHILADLGVESVRLLGAEPVAAGLADHGVLVTERVDLGRGAGQVRSGGWPTMML